MTRSPQKKRVLVLGVFDCEFNLSGRKQLTKGHGQRYGILNSRHPVCRRCAGPCRPMLAVVLKTVRWGTVRLRCGGVVPC